MKPSIFANLKNGAKFHNCTYWSIIDIQSHRILCWLHNYHIGNETLAFSGHVKIGL